MVLQHNLKTAVHNSGEKFIFRGEEGDGAISFKCLVAVCFRETNYDPMFLLVGELFM